jgi:two-component system, chemotaxis family, protein-glutamate methylesterase/glutaminase
MNLRVVVIDDSQVFVDALIEMLQRDGDIAVVGTGSDGVQALALVESLEPDLVAMDVRMPTMGGLEAVEQIMATRPTPILLLTSHPAHHGERAVFDALSRGALDLVSKAAIDGRWLRDHVRLLASVPVVYRRRVRARTPSAPLGFDLPSGNGGVGMVASTGGPPVLADVLSRLPADYPLPIVVVQHLAAGFAPSLVSWLEDVCPLEICIPQRGQAMRGGVVYVAPDDAHVMIGTRDRIALDSAAPPRDGHRPSGTLLLSSMAKAWGRRAIGVVLTGMGTDGGVGLLDIRRARGLAIAQDQATSTVYGMPRHARDLGAAEHVLAPAQIANELVRTARALGPRMSS